MERHSLGLTVSKQDVLSKKRPWALFVLSTDSQLIEELVIYGPAVRYNVSNGNLSRYLGVRVRSFNR